ncbi:hypothetical protein CCUG63695_00662 [Mycobacteroides franklinii]|uniref:Uncharacterized protein n=1 Tax=Mycobacteroides franklinii TaxID=948102 RepID=A0A4R8R7E8_9MYCO|nr:hypothetical protein CCUG64054_01296 [Mycobacteroides franklinii]TDZ49137.1 hypothetical protein CCUG63697_03673 [Mycobacteroides franklinii]TDZ59318.1 hypothetical protein CCUG63696_01300 [Mycobacteroides franklinii]TDZ66832.1 hypothetical protein CCUG63695_00662 [Mycobacteroides franklinii]TDZ72755.1 hypothetical protein CCUG64056_01296 [Mycobacteroides franklinii]
MVHQGGWVHDDVHGVGQTLPGIDIQPQVWVADIACQHLEVLFCQ